MLISPQDNVIVRPETKYIGNISSLLKIAAIQNNSSVDQTDMVNIKGEVISVPKSISKTRDLEGFSTSDIQPGDIAIFSFKVIYDFVQKEPDAEPVYRNRIFYNGVEYFAAHIRHIFGVIRAGEIIMANGYVMVSGFEEPKIFIPAHQKRVKGTTTSHIMHIGNPLIGETSITAKQGDEVVFNPKYAQKYQINGKPFCILQQSQILGKIE
jgi:co-chaperonin GroES (HSP10)